MNKQGLLSASADLGAVYRPDMSGGSDRVFRVSRPLFYRSFFPQIQIHTALTILLSVVKDRDVGASYDGLVDLFEFNQLGGGAIQKVRRSFIELSRDLYRGPSFTLSLDVVINET